MIYVLHHSKGTLLLSADDREQVFQWSECQLGNRAGIVSVTERDCNDADHWVEKDGTGITAREAGGCQPVISIMANHAQDVPGEHGGSECRVIFWPDARLKVREPTWH